MEIEIKRTLSDLLRAVANQTISESDFWNKFNSLDTPSGEPLAKIAYETATHYWGNFHSRNLLGMKVKPDQYQIQQGQEELNLVADGLEAGWSVAELKRRLYDI